MSQARGLRGVSKLRRKLRRLPDDIQRGIKNAVRDSGNLAVRAIIPEIPVQEGDLRDALTMKVGRDGLSAKVGYTPKWKRPWRKAGWRAAYTIFGTKGGTIKSGPAKGTHIPPQPPNNFMNRGWQKVRAVIFNKLTTSVDESLRKASRL